MRIPSERLRLRLLPEAVLTEALPVVNRYAVQAAELYGADPEDMQEAAGIGAWTAWETYNPDAGTQWATWLRRNVNWMVREALRDWGKARHKERRAFHASYRVVCLQDKVTPYSPADTVSGETTLEEVIEDPRLRFESPLLDQLEAEDLLRRMLPREREVFRSRYLGGEQKKDVAARLGVGNTRISQIEEGVRNRLQDEMQLAFDAGDPAPLATIPLDVPEPELARPFPRRPRPVPAIPNPRPALLSGPQCPAPNGTRLPPAPPPAAWRWQRTTAVTWDCLDPAGVPWRVRRNSKHPAGQQYRLICDGADEPGRFPDRRAAHLHIAVIQRTFAGAGHGRQG